MAVTSTLVGVTRDGRKIFRHSETGAVDTLLSVSVGGHKGRRVRQVTTKYSAAPTQAGVTCTLDSGAGAAFDAVVNTGSANAQTTVYLPDSTSGLLLGSDDALVVAAPAGGGGITASIAVYTEEV